MAHRDGPNSGQENVNGKSGIQEFIARFQPSGQSAIEKPEIVTPETLRPLASYLGSAHSTFAQRLDLAELMTRFAQHQMPELTSYPNPLAAAFAIEAAYGEIQHRHGSELQGVDATKEALITARFSRDYVHPADTYIMVAHGQDRQNGRYKWSLSTYRITDDGEKTTVEEGNIAALLGPGNQKIWEVGNGSTSSRVVELTNKDHHVDIASYAGALQKVIPPEMKLTTTTFSPEWAELLSVGSARRHTDMLRPKTSQNSQNVAHETGPYVRYSSAEAEREEESTLQAIVDRVRGKDHFDDTGADLEEAFRYVITRPNCVQDETMLSQMYTIRPERSVIQSVAHILPSYAKALLMADQGSNLLSSSSVELAARISQRIRTIFANHLPSIDIDSVEGIALQLAFGARIFQLLAPQRDHDVLFRSPKVQYDIYPTMGDVLKRLREVNRLFDENGEDKFSQVEDCFTDAIETLYHKVNNWRPRDLHLTYEQYISWVRDNKQPQREILSWLFEKRLLFGVGKNVLIQPKRNVFLAKYLPR